MQKLLLFFLTVWINIAVFSQNAQNMALIARWDDDTLPIASPNNLRVQYSGCWGLAVNNHEFAILGGARHVLIFDITIPAKPKLIGKFEGKTNTVWREFKSYKNRIYAVSDGATEGLMIFDMSNAPDTIIRSYYSNELFNSAHTITLDTSSGRIYLNGTNVANQGLLVLDVSQNPDKPTLLASTNLPGRYIHDSYVRNDTVYASSGFNGFYVYDFKNPHNPVVLASLPATGYQHNNWLTEDGRYAFCTEEIPTGRPILVVDLQDIRNANLEVAASFLHPLLTPGANSAIPHNVYIRGNLLFDSQYEDGLLVYNINNPRAPVRIGFYDTHPENTQYNTYFGCWGNYPWLPSGVIIAGDMQNGLHLLRLLSTNIPVDIPTVKVTPSPNPAVDILNVERSAAGSGGTLRLFALTGQLVANQNWLEGENALQIPVGHLTPGIYVLEVRFEQGNTVLKKVIVE